MAKGGRGAPERLICGRRRRRGGDLESRTAPAGMENALSRVSTQEEETASSPPSLTLQTPKVRILLNRNSKLGLVALNRCSNL